MINITVKCQNVYTPGVDLFWHNTVEMPFIQLQFRRDTPANWTSANPVLASGEMGIELGTELFKLGDGTTRWILLPYGGLRGATGQTGMTGDASTAVGPTGDTGATGAQSEVTGPTGTAGDKFLTATTTAETPAPTQGGSVS